MKSVFNFLISFLIFCLIIMIMFISCSKKLISSKNISEFISDGNILDIDVNVIFNNENAGITLKEKIISVAIENKIDEKIINDILESKQINYMLGDFFNQTILYVIAGGDRPQLLDKTVENIKEEAAKSLEKHINVMIEPEELEQYIENYCHDITKIIPNRNDILNTNNLDMFKSIIQFNTLYLYIILVLLLVLISLLNNWYRFIKTLGICMFIAGIIFVGIGSMDYIINGFINSNIHGMKEFISPLITNVLTIWFKGGVLVSFSSIVLLLLYMTIDKISK